MKGTSGIQRGTEVSGIKVEAGGVFSQTARWAEAGVPFLSPWTPTEPENWQASAISEIPSTWLTLFDHGDPLCIATFQGWTGYRIQADGRKVAKLWGCLMYL